MATAEQTIVAAIRRLLPDRERPLLVGLDGRSGSGKTHLSGLVARELEAAVVPFDDFFAAGVTDAEWDARDARQRVEDVFDCARLRREVLEPLLDGREGRWHAFDFERGTRPDGTYGFKADPEVLQPRPVVLLDGVYSGRPELSDLVELAMLVEAPPSTRRARLAEREEADFLARWYDRWQPAEDYYFSHIRPPSSFDLVVHNGDAGAAGRDLGFQTRRLVAREWHSWQDDEWAARPLTDVVCTVLSERVTEALPIEWRGAYSADRARRWVDERDRDGTTLLVVDRSSRAAIGLVILGEEELSAGGVEIRLGYLLAEAAWGNGFATELVRGLVDRCREMGVASIVGGVERDNAPSRRVLEKNGFVHDAGSEVASADVLGFRLILTDN